MATTQPSGLDASSFLTSILNSSNLTNGVNNNQSMSVNNNNQPNINNSNNKKKVILCKVCGVVVPRRKEYHPKICEACQKFFRRNCSRRSNLFCSGGNRQCVVEASSRRCCPRCRFDRCLAVGMQSKLLNAVEISGGCNNNNNNIKSASSCYSLHNSAAETSSSSGSVVSETTPNQLQAIKMEPIQQQRLHPMSINNQLLFQQQQFFLPAIEPSAETAKNNNGFQGLNGNNIMEMINNMRQQQQNHFPTQMTDVDASEIGSLMRNLISSSTNRCYAPSSQQPFQHQQQEQTTKIMPDTLRQFLPGVKTTIDDRHFINNSNKPTAYETNSILTDEFSSLNDGERLFHVRQRLMLALIGWHQSSLSSSSTTTTLSNSNNDNNKTAVNCSIFAPAAAVVADNKAADDQQHQFYLPSPSPSPTNNNNNKPANFFESLKNNNNKNNNNCCIDNNRKSSPMSPFVVVGDAEQQQNNSPTWLQRCMAAILAAADSTNNCSLLLPTTVTTSNNNNDNST